MLGSEEAHGHDSHDHWQKEGDDSCHEGVERKPKLAIGVVSQYWLEVWSWRLLAAGGLLRWLLEEPTMRGRRRREMHLGGMHLGMMQTWSKRLHDHGSVMQLQGLQVTPKGMVIVLDRVRVPIGLDGGMHVGLQGKKEHEHKQRGPVGNGHRNGKSSGYRGDVAREEDGPKEGQTNGAPTYIVWAKNASFVEMMKEAKTSNETHLVFSPPKKL